LLGLVTNPGRLLLAVQGNHPLVGSVPYWLYCCSMMVRTPCSQEQCVNHGVVVPRSTPVGVCIWQGWLQLQHGVRSQRPRESMLARVVAVWLHWRLVYQLFWVVLVWVCGCAISNYWQCVFARAGL